MPKGVSKSRLPAVQTCNERGWIKGTVRMSSTWKNARTVQEVKTLEVVLTENNAKGYPVTQRLKALPADVKPATSDDAFMRWAESEKPCRYCDRPFVGPICPCETARV